MARNLHLARPVSTGRRMLPAAVAAVFASPGVPAQQSEEPGAEAVEEIVVTGTRIKRRDFSSPSPLATIDRNMVEFTGLPSLEETLNQMPQVVPDFGRTSNNPGDGTSRINLRGFGSARTLVLLNGRRLAPSGVGSAVDINNLPQALIERIEIITGGATTVYGSDAVAGVVNFITRDDFYGLSIDASAAVTQKGDANIWDATIAWGMDFGGGNGHVVLYAGTHERDELLADEREFTRIPLRNNDETGELELFGSGATPSGVIFLPGVDLGTNRPWVTFDANGVPRGFNDPDDRYNFGPVNYLQIPLSRDYAGVMGSYGLANGYELYFESQFSHNEAAQQLAEVPAIGFVDVATNSQFLTPEAQQLFADNYEVSPGLSSILVGRRLVEVGPRIVENERDYWRAVAGLRGEVGGGWEFDGWLTYTRADESEFYLNDASRSRFAQGLLVDPVTGQCVDASNGCVPVDIFGPGQMSEEAAAFLRVTGVENVTKRTQTLASFFVSGAIADLWAGPLDTAFGLEWRSDDASFRADDVLFTGDTLGFRGEAPVEGRENVTEAYAEFLLPLARETFLAEYLGLEIGGRYSDYENAGGVWTYKIGGEWQPMQSVRFRAMHQQSVRAPNNAELFTEQFSELGPLLPGDDDPCSASADPVANGNVDKCIAQGISADQIGVFESIGSPTQVIHGGNPALIPEEAETVTLGVVLTPGFLPSWTMAVDYFTLDLEDSIGEIDAIAICFDPQNTDNLFCENIRRDPLRFDVIEIFEPLSNRGFIRTEGVDTQLSYTSDLPPWLEFGGSSAVLNVDLTWTHLFEYSWQQNPASSIVDCTGFFGEICSFGVDQGAFNSIPDDRVTTVVNYSSGPLTVHLTSRWIDGTQNALALQRKFSQGPEPLIAIPEVGSKHYLDLGVGYRITDDITLRLGVENLTNTDPPLMPDTFGMNTDTGLHDVFGRTFYVSLSAGFFR